MARVTAEQASTKWKDRLSAATQQITDGVNRVTVAPGQKAAAQADLWIRKVTDSKDKWKRRVGAVTLPEWQQAMTQKGIPRIAQGAAANQGKMTSFMTEFLPHLDRGVAIVDSMPKGSIEDSINRAATMIRHNADFKRSGRA